MGADFRRDLLADGLPAETVAERVRRSRALITRAPVGVVLCLSMEGMERYPDEGRRACELAMAEQSVALAGGHLLLAAHAAGLAGVWLCAPLFCPDSVTRALHLPLGWEPRALLLLGYPDGEPQLTPRKGVEQVTVWR
jgi:F420 biosynthesis protein FbiB-like protein